MKNYFKKFSIMFVMSLAIIGVGAIQNGNAANAATVGQQLTSPESGWQRIDDADVNIKYEDNVNKSTYNKYYDGTLTSAEKIKMYVKTDKIRLGCDLRKNWRCSNIAVDIDGSLSRVDQDSNEATQGLFFEAQNLEYKTHIITIYVDEKTNVSSIYNDKFITLDYIDIDKDGVLLSYDKSITLDKSTMDLKVGDSGDLTATTPIGIGVKWITSDPSIATVDQNGKITGIKEGTCTITATTTDGLTATCNVNVTKQISPSNPGGNTGTTTGNLCGCKTNSYGILNINTPSGFTQNNNNGGNGNSSNNSGNTNNSGNSGNNYSNNNNSNSNNNYYYYNNYYISYNTTA